MTRPSVDDLLIAAEWLECYEAAPEDDIGTGCHRVALYLRDLVASRQKRLVVDRIVKEVGGDRLTTESRAKLRRLATARLRTLQTDLHG